MSPITVRSLADIDADIKRYTERLEIPAVQASSHWCRETENKIRQFKAERDELLAMGAAA